MSSSLSGLLSFTEASAVDRALELCREQPFDLAIVDIDFGQQSLSGLELVRVMHSTWPEMTICIHSNRRSPEQYREALQAGASAFIPKPMNASQFVGLLGDQSVMKSSA